MLLRVVMFAVHTCTDTVPYSHHVPVINGEEVVSKRKNDMDFSFMTDIRVDLLTPLESFQHILVRCIHYLSLNPQTLQLISQLWTYN